MILRDFAPLRVVENPGQRTPFTRLVLADGEPLDVDERHVTGSGVVWEPAAARDAQTRTTTYNDSQFIRTALIMDTRVGADREFKGGSLDVVDHIKLKLSHRGEPGAWADPGEIERRKHVNT